MRKPHPLAHIVWLALSEQEVVDIHDVTSRLGDHGVVSSSYRSVAKDVLGHMHSQGLLKRVKRNGYRRSNTGFRQWLFNAERTKDPAGQLIDYLAGDRRTLRRMPETFDSLNEFRAYLKKWGDAGTEMDAMSAEVWQRWQSHCDNEASECGSLSSTQKFLGRNFCSPASARYC